MALERFTEDLNFVTNLGDNPRRDDGLSTPQFKSIFDKAGLAIQNFINNKLIPGIEGAVSEEGLLAQVNVVLGKKLDKFGGTMTGALNVIEPTESTNAVPKGYVDTQKKTITLQFSAWSDTAPYTQTITVDGLSDSVFARAYPETPEDAAQLESFNDELVKITDCKRSKNKMTFRCLDEKPVRDIPVIVEVYV